MRISGIEAIQRLVACVNKDKRNSAGADAINDLLGHRDSNVLTISSFYKSDASLNYFGMLATDAQRSVRLRFCEMIGEWSTGMEDRWDHHERLIPFLLTGLTDDDDEIRNLALSYIDRCGAEYAEEHHDEFLEMRQLGVDGDVLSNHGAALPPPFHECVFFSLPRMTEYFKKI